MAAQLPSSEPELRDLLSSAVSSRAQHIRKDKETITMANVRRLLENDLGLDKFTLDAHKSILNPLVDEVLLGADNGASEEEEQDEDDDENAHDVDETLKGASSSKTIKKASHKKARAEESSEDLNSQEDSHIEAPKKKKQKKTKKEKVQSKEAHGHDSNSHPDVSEDSDVSEVKKPKKVAKTEIVKTTQDKKIDRLRKTIKACGLGVPPSIYKKAKQLDEDKQNSFIIKELEGILNRKGLSANATEKEIKAVKRKIAREKDLEGIEMTNIITEPRGRRAASQLFSPVYRPPKPPIREQESESESERESESESGSEEDAKKEDGAESFEDDKTKPDNNKQPNDDKVPADDKKLDDDKRTDDDKKPNDDKEPDDDKKPINDKCAPE